MKELPPICKDSEHAFIPRGNIITPTCGSFDGADVVSELMVLSSTSNQPYTPNDGDVCSKCFQIRGQLQGYRDKHLEFVFQTLAGLE